MTFVSLNPNTVISFAQEDNNLLIVVITGARIVTPNEDRSLVIEYDIQQLGLQSELLVLLYKF